jgi:hypothetical protein
MARANQRGSRDGTSVMGHKRFTEIVGHVGFNRAVAGWPGEAENCIAGISQLVGENVLLGLINGSRDN